SSATRSWLFSALAAAESISLRMSPAAPREEKFSRLRASSIGRPRTWSATSRALRGATRTKRALARTTRRGGASLGSAFFAFAPLLGLAAPLPLAAAFGFAAGFALLWARGLAAVFGFASDLASVFFAGALRVAGFLAGAFFGAA